LAKIIMIDDDYATEILAERLTFSGFDVCRIDSAKKAMESISTIAAADLVILDIIMQQPTRAIRPGISGDSTTGMRVLEAIRKSNAEVPILVFSATNDPNVIDAVKEAAHTQFLSKWSGPSLKELVHKVQGILGINIRDAGPRPFIVHGHDEAAKLGLKNYLQNTLKLPEPVILHEQPSLGRTIIEKFEDYARGSDLAFVLLTPDDRIVEPNRSNDEKRRARQNVIFELGYFLGALGRSSGRVFLLYKEPLELPTDLSGVVYIDISAGIEAAGERIRREVANVR
jgi:predicted nucleotide-binding protein